MRATGAIRKSGGSVGHLMIDDGAVVENGIVHLRGKEFETLMAKFTHEDQLELF